MPLKCCITNFRSNYKPEEEAVSVFSFPDESKEGDLTRGGHLYRSLQGCAEPKRDPYLQNSQ